MYDFTKIDLIDFIKECRPQFGKVENKYKMFTLTTQWIESEDINELLAWGIECYHKYGANSTPLSRLADEYINKEIPKFDKEYNWVDKDTAFAKDSKDTIEFCAKAMVDYIENL